MTVIRPKIIDRHHKLEFISLNELLTLGVPGLSPELLRECLYFAKTAATAAAATAAASGTLSVEGEASLFEVVAAAGSFAVSGAGASPGGPEPAICNEALPEAIAASGDFAALTAALLRNIHRLGEFTPLTLILFFGVTLPCPECVWLLSAYYDMWYMYYKGALSKHSVEAC